MRNAIRNKLIDGLPEVGERVYQPSMAGPATQKPYAVVKRGGDVPTKMTHGFEIPFQIWLYSDVTSHTVLDALQGKVIKLLMRKDLTTANGQVFSLEYEGGSEDFYDDELKALTRRVDFRTVRAY